MPQNHKKQPELVREQSTKARLEAFRTEVEFLHLKYQKNDLQKKLMGMAIDEHIDALINLEIAFTERRPELMATFVEERNMFLNSVGVPEERYREALERDKKSRQDAMEQQIKAELAKQPADPSQQLHAIHEEIKAQVIEPPVDIPPQDEPIPPPEPEPIPEPVPEQHDPILYPAEDPLP